MSFGMLHALQSVSMVAKRENHTLLLRFLLLQAGFLNARYECPVFVCVLSVSSSAIVPVSICRVTKRAIGDWHTFDVLLTLSLLVKTL